MPFPQYCGGLFGENENEGTSHYNSFQAKYGRNFSGGFYMEANYTYSRLTTDASSTTQATAEYGGIGAVINPYQGSRNMSISPDDIPNTLSIMAVYDLPFGKGKQFLNNEGVMGHVLGGWTLATTMKFTSGMPLYFRDSSVCGVPVAIPGGLHSGDYRQRAGAIMGKRRRQQTDVQRFGVYTRFCV